MSETAPPARPFYVTGGTLKPGEPSYVERRADTDLFESLLAGDFCYVLTARQMGKSSLMARTAKRLGQSGIAAAIVDLTQIGSERGTEAAAQWYFGVANKIHQQLGITAPLRPWWQERSDLSSVQRLTDLFRELVLAHVPGRIVVFVDEIDSTIGLPFADDFFAALRACYNARATDDAFGRLTFVLLGVATPDQLIRDPTRTPFNIGKRIDLTDFTLDEAQVLAAGLHADADEAGQRLGRVLHWTGGHPYLTQAVCRAVRDKGDTGTAEEAVDPQVAELFLAARAQREETNLKHTRARLERRGAEGRRLLQLYQRVRQGKVVADQPSAPLFAQLKLAGVVKATAEGRLVVRNRIYETVFTSAWARGAMPANRGGQLAAATLAAACAGALIWYAAFQPRPYEKAFRAAIEDDGYSGAAEAYAALHTNPFSRKKADVLMLEFWAQRALKYALTGDRDRSLLCNLQGLKYGENEALRRQAGNLIGGDYEHLQLTLRHPASVNDVDFSPDGKTLATGSDDGNVRLWSTGTGALTSTLSYTSSIYALDFSPDGKVLAAGSVQPGRSAILLWDLSRRRLAIPPLEQRGSVSDLAFSPDGRLLAFGGSGNPRGYAQILDARTGKPTFPPLVGGNVGLPVQAVEFSPDGKVLAAGCMPLFGTGGVKLWNAQSGRRIGSLSTDAGVMSVSFSPDGRRLATGPGGILVLRHTVQIWDLAKAAAEWSIETGDWSQVAFSPNGQLLATGSGASGVQFWEAASGLPLETTLLHEGGVALLAFAPRGKAIATASGDTVRIWKVPANPAPFRPQYHLEGSVQRVAQSPDGMFLAVAAGGHARLLGTGTGNIARSLSPAQDGEVAISPDGQTIAIANRFGGYEGELTLWREGLPHQVAANFSGGMVFSPDGQALAIWSYDGAAELRDARTGMQRFPALRLDSGVTGVAFLADGRALAVASGTGLRFFDVKTGTLLRKLSLPDGVLKGLALSPDGRVAALPTGSGILLVDAVRGRLLGSPLALPAQATTIAFSPDGRWLFAAGGRWLATWSWDGQRAVAQSSQLLDGFWMQSFRFPLPSGRDPGLVCEDCIQAVLGDTANGFHLKTLSLAGPSDPPVAGSPNDLLEKWQGRLGLTFGGDEMRPVPGQP